MTALDTAQHLVQFLAQSPSPFHCVAEMRRQLDAAGFVALAETDSWRCTPGMAYYVSRGDASLIAFRLGQQPASGTGLRLVGAHTDSPNLRLKPHLAKQNRGLLQLDVDVYGGVLLATWADRDLGLAGRVLLDHAGAPQRRLLRIDKPLCRIANVAIHLNREVNDKGLVLNKHQHLAPLVAEWSGAGTPEEAVQTLLAETLQVEPEHIIGHDLCLYDLQPPTLGGAHDEFIFGARLDNQAMCHAALQAMLNATSADVTAVIALFDHEEVGSLSARGADGPFLDDVLGRICGPASDDRLRAYARSVMISADMAHAVHPNYADLHDVGHMPRLNGGPIIKTNYNLRYASDGESSAMFRALCRAHGVPYQEFVNRPDLACGTTIGPISAAKLGIRTVDVGNPMLSMHSIREMAGSHDPAAMTQVFTTFLSGADISA
ncbi:MAG: M18 family aminopeptidase [Candidatus Tectomicrobia bacterium]|uniref:M18 family aminopeptidase n=1 Tax=Tectimicrobiota bacterium TaxID=2528274 RepID=A0A937VZW5_UNCTE|nr:M18 family aminopeptidase [Candidatus Tectomicrobia bacterium]